MIPWGPIASAVTSLALMLAKLGPRAPVLAQRLRSTLRKARELDEQATTRRNLADGMLGTTRWHVSARRQLRAQAERGRRRAEALEDQALRLYLTLAQLPSMTPELLAEVERYAGWEDA